MSVKFENDRITGNTYDNRKTLFFHGCLWDKENKNWFVPDSCDKKFIMKLVNAMNKNEKLNQKLWKEACHDLGYSWVKKSTESYYKVKERFEKLLQERKQQNHDESDDSDSDDE